MIDQIDWTTKVEALPDGSFVVTIGDEESGIVPENEEQRKFLKEHAYTTEARKMGMKYRLEFKDREMTPLFVRTMSDITQTLLLYPDDHFRIIQITPPA